MKEYLDFLEKKQKRIMEYGFTVNDEDINHNLFMFQRWVLKMALNKGRFAIFADCGLGKTLIQMEWSRHIVTKTGKPKPRRVAQMKGGKVRDE